MGRKVRIEFGVDNVFWEGVNRSGISKERGEGRI